MEMSAVTPGFVPRQPTLARRRNLHRNLTNDTAQPHSPHSQYDSAPGLGFEEKLRRQCPWSASHGLLLRAKPLVAQVGPGLGRTTGSKNHVSHFFQRRGESLFLRPVIRVFLLLHHSWKRLCLRAVIVGRAVPLWVPDLCHSILTAPPASPACAITVHV